MIRMSMCKTVRNRRDIKRLNLHKAVIETLESRQLLASIAAVTPFNGQQSFGLSSNLTVRFNEPINPATITSTTLQLRDPAGTVVPSSITYNSANSTATIDPTANLISSTSFYTLRVVGGTDGVKDSLGGQLNAAKVDVSFSTGTAQFTEQTVFSGLDNPTAVEFAPDGRVFVAEKRGVVRVFDSLTDTTPEIFADLRAQVHNYWDRGLLGLTIDPQFTSGRPYIYVLYTADMDINGNFPKWGTTTGDSDPGQSTGATTVTGRLSRLTVGSNGLMQGSEQVLIHDWQNQFPSHSIGDLQFGADGFLYASSGDGASFVSLDSGNFGNPFNEPTDEGGALRSQDIRSSGDPTGLSGTVIRIDPDTGAAAATNPNNTSSDLNNRRIVAYGLRNPFRFTFRPGTNELWIADTGWGWAEEINRISDTTDAKVENFGWPAYEGYGRQGAYDAANLPLLESLYNAGPSAHDSPWFSYLHAEQVVPGSSEPTGGSSPTGIAFYNGTAYPDAFRDALFFTDFSRRQIYIMYRGLDGLPDVSTRQIFRSLNSGAVDLKVGPDGTVYYVDLYGGRIVRFNFANNSNASASKLTGQVIGSTATPGNDGAKAFDGLAETFFNATDATGAWVGLDLGSPRWVKQIRFTPRTNEAGKMLGGEFQASNDPTFPANARVTLLTINSQPSNNQYTSANVNAGGAAYRYVRYVGPANSNANVGDIEFYAGNGLAATYYDNVDFTGSTVSRIDQTIDFSWGNDSPSPSIQPDSFSARWTGKIQAIETGTYTFRTTTDDGARLWVNGQLLIDQLIAQAPTSYTATLNLTAGELYDIRFDYTEIAGGAQAQLAWQRPGQSGTSVVPVQNLFSTGPSTNTPPVPSIDAPLANLRWAVGDTVTFSGSATDAQDGVIPASNLVWTLAILHDSEINPGNPHVHVVQTFSGINSGSFVAPDHEFPSWLELSLTATDSNGQSTTVTRRIDPLTINLTVVSSPAGATLELNSTGGVSSVTRTVIAGGTNSVSAPASFVGSDGKTYIFTGWSDGGAPSHSITAPLANTTLTATYALPPAPVAPGTLVAAAISTTQINLTWADNSGNETGFKIERRLSPAGAWQQIAVTGVNINTLADTGLTGSTAYDYRVRSTNANGDSDFTTIATATTLSAAVAPIAPTLLVASTVTTTSVRLDWTDNAVNETAYRVERRLTGGTFATIATLAANATSFDDTGLTSGTGYDYRVRAINTVGDSAPSNTVVITTTSANTVPVAPGNLSSVVTANPTVVTISWTDNAVNETDFIIQRRYTNWLWSDIGTAPANATRYVDSTAFAKVTYEYRVLARNAAGVSAWSAGVIVNTDVTGPAAPAAPTSLTATPASSTRVNLTWVDNATTETGYRVDRRVAGGTWAQITSLAANTSAYADTTVLAGNTYEYRVYAFNAATVSAFSNAAVVTTPGGVGGVPAAPSGLTGILTTKPLVRLNWTDNANNETSYIIQRRYTNWIWSDVGVVGADITTFLDTTGIGNVTYEYRVVATGAGASSPFSNSVIINTA
jgi:glucose/arabinose dehydrogenase